MNTISLRTERLLTLSQLSGVGPAALRKVLSLSEDQELSYEAIANRVPSVAKAISEQSALHRAIESAGKQIEEAKRFGARIISVCDPDYPKLLIATKDDPVILYVRGSLAREPSESVAVIGTREPTIHGELIARRITEFFVEKGWSIVSGLAIGCDSIAHQTAVLAGGHTVAVLAHGLQMISPARHRKLAESILETGGALVSEYPFGREVQKAQYVKRDRTQAGLARGVVMIQSDTVGGSLHASRAALSYDRWLAVPYPTERDREANEPKTQANLLIANGSEKERCALLHCTPRQLGNVFILKSREQYPQLLGDLNEDVHLRPRNTDWTANTSMRQDDLLGTSSVMTSVEAPPRQVPVREDLAIASAGDTESEYVAHSTTESDTDVEGWLSKLPLTTSDSTRQGFPIAPKLLQAPSTQEANSDWLTFSLDNPEIANALFARLEYVKSRLDVVDATYRGKAGVKKIEHLQLLTLVIDDLLAQMEHAVDLLDAVAGILQQEDKHLDMLPKEERDSVDAENCIEAPKIRAADLLAELNELRLGSSHRLILVSNFADSAQKESSVDGETTSQRAGADLRLASICEKFNEMVWQTLYKQGANLSL